MRSRGFTLLEILVVVFVISITVTVILLNVSLVNPERRIKNVSQQAVKLIRFAHQQAILEQKNLALSLTKKGYEFIRYDGENWVKFENKRLRPKPFDEKIKSELEVEGRLIQPQKKKLQPHILILASGELSVFKWTLEDTQYDISVLIQGQYNGDVSEEQLL